MPVRPRSAAETPFADVPFIVVDIETTGVGAHGGDRITEVAAVLLHRHAVTTVFTSLVNPGCVIPSYITHLTGISNAMVAGAPRFDQIAGELATHLVGRVFVAHNASFDWNFLSAEYARVTATPFEAIAPSRLCTVRLARRLLSHLPRRNLDAVAHHYDVRIEGRHRAAGDAIATAHVLRGLLGDAERRGMHTWEALDESLARRTSRARKRSALPASTDGAEGA